jgi:hypothetical protein
MVPTFENKTLITDLYSMNPPDSRGATFLPSYILAEVNNLVLLLLQSTAEKTCFSPILLDWLDAHGENELDHCKLVSRQLSRPKNKSFHFD